MRARNQNSQRGSRLAADNLQEVLSSAKNAANKGAQQFLTPPEIAAALALPLPTCRPTIVDFQCGAGALLAGAANHTTAALLGIDIDPRARIPRLKHEEDPTTPAEGRELLPIVPRRSLVKDARKTVRRSVMHADLTTIYPLLCDVGWEADLLTLNPPFSLKWYTERLAGLAESGCEAVADAWEIASRKPEIDSTRATFLMALDRLTHRGEGYMICNQATARRLFDRSTPEGRHIWLWLTVPNFFAGVGRKLGDTDQSQMEIAVLYFARWEQSQTRELRVEGRPEMDGTASQMRAAAQGSGEERGSATSQLAQAITAALQTTQNERYIWREGYDLTGEMYADKKTASLFEIVKEEHKLTTDQARSGFAFNLWLDPFGRIRRYLTPFQSCSRKIDKQTAKDLDSLDGQSPMSLVVQKSTRQTLLRAVNGGIWRVQPELVEAVDQALREYDQVRAPFYPLNEVQRLGYLDESDSILCKKTFPPGRDEPLAPYFVAGHRYQLASRTVEVQRDEERPNLSGIMEELEITGQELLIEIKAESGESIGFTHDPKSSDVAPESGKATIAALFDLQTLVAHFEIPEVPDIAQMRPQEYLANIAKLRAIEEALAA